MRSSADERRVGTERKGQNAKGMITKNEYIIAAFGIKMLCIHIHFLIYF